MKNLLELLLIRIIFFLLIFYNSLLIILIKIMMVKSLWKKLKINFFWVIKIEIMLKHRNNYNNLLMKLILMEMGNYPLKNLEKWWKILLEGINNRIYYIFFDCFFKFFVNFIIKINIIFLCIVDKARIKFSVYILKIYFNINGM